MCRVYRRNILKFPEKQICTLEKTDVYAMFLGAKIQHFKKCQFSIS